MRSQDSEAAVECQTISWFGLF